MNDLGFAQRSANGLHGSVGSDQRFDGEGFGNLSRFCSGKAEIAEGIADRTFDSADPDEAADTILHLMGSIRPLITELFGASPLEAEALIERLVRRLRFLGTVVDRILGIPEGSLEFVDHEAVLSMAAVCRPGLRGVEPSAPDLPPVRLSATRDAR